jgi:predicted amidophosphoribosyltransferase
MWQGRCVECSRWVEADDRPAICPECGAPWGGRTVPQARSRRDLPPSWYAQGMGDRRLRGDPDAAERCMSHWARRHRREEVV